MRQTLVEHEALLFVTRLMILWNIWSPEKVFAWDC